MGWAARMVPQFMSTAPRPDLPNPATKTTLNPKSSLATQSSCPREHIAVATNLRQTLRWKSNTHQRAGASSVEIDCLFEYGWGGTEEQAINDLVSSLGDYKLWLIKHKDNLAECSARDLELIENMVA